MRKKLLPVNLEPVMQDGAVSSEVTILTESKYIREDDTGKQEVISRYDIPFGLSPEHWPPCDQKAKVKTVDGREITIKYLRVTTKI